MGQTQVTYMIKAKKVAVVKIEGYRVEDRHVLSKVHSLSLKAKWENVPERAQGETEQ